MAQRSSIGSAAVAVTLIVAMAGWVLTAPAVAEGETCQGEPATLIGGPGTKLVGTGGDDVILTAGATQVEAADGNDRICVTGNTRFVHAGLGNDHVTTDDWVVRTWVYLEDGDDTIIGGGRIDYVYAGPGNDHVATGPGDDSYDGYASPGAEENVDTVTLGPGDDTATVNNAQLTAPIDGGTGFNTLVVGASSGDISGPWVVDNVMETATRNGVVWLSWDRFGGFVFPAWEVEGRVDFVGSDADERVTARQEFEYGPDIGSWQLGGGDDEATFDGLIGPADGGLGSDWVRVVGWADERSLSLEARITIDLAQDEMRRGTGTSAISIPGMENAEVSDFVVSTLRGDDQDNELVVGQACLARLLGRAGDDRLRARGSPGCSSRTAEAFGIRRTVRAYGDLGDDILIGRGTPDLLVGDRGSDFANGRDGDDACSAEYKKACERRP